MRRSLPLALAAAVALAVPAAAAARPSGDQARLLARAVLPARTFAPGPASGTLLGSEPINGVPVPFRAQPVQGFSAALSAGDGRLWVMPDNGYGAVENSDDFHLRVYLIRPAPKTASGGPGTMDVERFIELRDPDHRIPFPIVNAFSDERVLTGADLDIESMQRAEDGSLWFGEEFGPFLIHTDATGRVLHAPFPLPDPTIPGQDIRAPQNPFSEESSPLRAMNAMRADAQAHGDVKTPVVSPDANLLDDGDPATGDPFRKAPPAGSGLSPSSSELIVASLHRAGFKLVPYTVNDPAQMHRLIKLGVDGLISDRPDLLRQIADSDPNTPAGFDVQGHRGGRNLRPENTLPAMEAGLDNRVTTLETDMHLTKDGVPVLSHDPHVQTGKCRRTDGRPYAFAHEVLIKDLTLAEIRAQFICDGVIRTGTPQTNDRALSSVAVAFARDKGIRDAYSMPTVQELYDFVSFYVDWYRTGPGRSDPGAAARADAAANVRFNIETKLNPRSDRDPHGVPFDERTPGPETIARALGEIITKQANPFRAQTSGGFEGMALGPDGDTLLPMLEKPLVGAPPGQTQIFSFDLGTERYTTDRWTYRFEPRGVSIGDFQLADALHGLVVERDNTQGDLNGFKALEEVALGPPGSMVAKRPAADLMHISDPHGISLPARSGDVGLGDPFAFPFTTIEDLVLLGRRRVAVLNDNNFPFSVGRHVGSGAPDDNELIVLRLARAIGREEADSR